MVQITEVSIISIFKSDDCWSIEGDIIFEDDLESAFEATYLYDEDEIEELSLGLDIDGYDVRALYQMIKDAAEDFEE